MKGEIATTVLKYRKITKASQTYLRNVINGSPDGIFRVSFNQCGARTGRFSSSGYEIKGQLQNIPRTGRGVIGHIRHIFNPSPNYGFGFIDYEQIEMRLCAHFTKDEHMLEAIRKGEDLHSMTCIRVFNKSEQDKDWKKFRYIAKTLNFAVVYGVGAEKFTNSVYESTNGEIDIPLAEAAEYINKYKEQHYKLMGLFSAVEEEVALTGGVRNPYGRFMPVEMDKPYTGVNYLIQSTAADVIKRAMIACHQRMRGTQSRMLMQVHDELIFEIHKEDGLDLLKDLGKIMENNEFSVPLTVSISKGKSWGEKEAV